MQLFAERFLRVGQKSLRCQAEIGTATQTSLHSAIYDRPEKVDGLNLEEVLLLRYE
jgi:hypothetical protein